MPSCGRRLLVLLALLAATACTTGVSPVLDSRPAPRARCADPHEARVIFFCAESP